MKTKIPSHLPEDKDNLLSTEGCHVGLFREFEGTACCTYGQSNTTIYSRLRCISNNLDIIVRIIAYIVFAPRARTLVDNPLPREQSSAAEGSKPGAEPVHPRSFLEVRFQVEWQAEAPRLKYI